MSRMKKVEDARAAPVKQTGAVPQLRFSRFQDEWSPKALGDVAEFSKGKGISKSDIVEGGTIPCIRYGELYTVYGNDIDEVVSFTEGRAADLTFSKGGEVIIPASGESANEIATAAVIRRAGVALGGDLNILRTDADGAFLAFYLSGKKRREIAAVAQGNSVVHLYGGQLAKLPVCIPDPVEQKEIASFLSSIDTKIDTLRQQQDALTRFKTGLMQKIFSQEIRFTREDGSAFPEWEEKRLGDVFQERSSRGNPDGELLSVTMDRGIVKTADMDRRDNSSADRSNYKSVEVGDIAYNSMRMWQGASGVADTPGIVSPAYTVVYAKAPQVMAYWGYHLKLPGMIRLFERYSQGLTPDTWNLKYPAFAKIPVQLPCIDERRMIADALSAVDDKIAAVTDQITRMETFKKGLLQQMFV